MTLRGSASNRPDRIGTAFGGSSVISMRRFSTRALADQPLADPQASRDGPSGASSA